MKRSTILVTAALLTLGVAGGAAAYGKHRFGDPDRRAGYMVSYIADELALDSTQEQALTTLKDEVLALRTALQTQMQPLPDEVRNLISAETFDQAKALELVNARLATLSGAAPALISAFGNFFDTLDAGQKAEIQTFIDEHQHRHGKHRSDSDD